MEQFAHFSGDTPFENCNSGISAQSIDFPDGVESPPEQQASPWRDTAVQTGTEPAPESLRDPQTGRGTLFVKLSRITVTHNE